MDIETISNQLAIGRIIFHTRVESVLLKKH